MISILLPTFNGELFLEEQLKSVFSQTYAEGFEIHVRDDGSNDETLAILKRFSNEIRLHFDSLGRLGTCNSLLQIIDKIPDSTGIVFCDQDDIWLPNHLNLVSEFLQSKKAPSMLISRHSLIDEQGFFLRTKPINSVHFHRNCLVENLATGSGLAINQAGLQLMKQIKFNSKLHMDYQLYITFALLGSVYIADVPTINYRIHANNQVGINIKMNSKIGSYYNAIKFLSIKSRVDDVETFLCANSNLMQFSPFYQETLAFLKTRKLSIVSRFVYLCRNGIVRSTRIEKIFFSILFLFGKI